jgi:type I restriction enzyme S subunit
VLRAQPTILDSRYLFQWVKTSDFVGSMVRQASGASYPAVTDRVVLESRIPLPSLPDQRRIAEILGRAEALRAKRRAALAHLDTLAQAIFLDLFGDPSANPRAWRQSELGDLIRSGPQNGLYKPASDYGSGTPILRIDAFYDGAVRDLSRLKRVRLSESERSLFELTQGDIVVNRVNSIDFLGKSALIPVLLEPTVFESNMMRMSVDSAAIEPGYVVQFLQSQFVRGQILAASKNAVNQSSINQQDVKALRVNVPPLPLQHEFARRVAAVDKLKTAQRASLAHLDALFASLQHRAFRGEL